MALAGPRRMERIEAKLDDRDASERERDGP